MEKKIMIRFWGATEFQATVEGFRGCAEGIEKPEIRMSWNPWEVSVFKGKEVVSGAKSLDQCMAPRKHSINIACFTLRIKVVAIARTLLSPFF